MLKIFVINPGSTSDELSFFDGDEEIFHAVTRYSAEEMKPYESKSVISQYELRFALIMKTLEEKNVDIGQIDAVIGRGGLLKPIPGGTYLVTDDMLEDLKNGLNGDHPSNLGGILAKALADRVKEFSGKEIDAYISDPVVVDEMWKWSRYSGMPENPRISIFHALNQRRVGRNVAENMGKKYEELNMIIIHGGGGISVGLHRKGRVVDVNNALDGDGPFTPQRSGGVPSGGLAKMCFSGNFTHQEIKLKIKGRGGLVAYLGTSDLIILEKFIENRDLTDKEKSQILPSVTVEYAKDVIEAMAYQICKETGSLCGALGERPDAIVLTGGIAYCDFIVEFIKNRVQWMGSFFCLPGGDEMKALKDAAFLAQKGSVPPQTY